ncbi:MAG: tyrosine-type recombinase/integrase [Campylobacterales bacterium]|nr:tyrosine-type recombinase/integrase [Campylobacterales bacterium]
MNLVSEKLPDFLRYLEKYRGSSEKSVQTYEGVLSSAVDKLIVEKSGETLLVDLMEYRLSISNQNKKTISKKVSIIRSYLDWLKEGGVILKIKNDVQIKGSKTLPKPVKTFHIKEALEQCTSLERILLLSIYSLGLRISEVVDLKAESFKKDWVEVLGKGSKVRSIPVIKELQIEIENYLQDKNNRVFLFEEDGKQLSESQLRYKVNIIFKRIGMKVTPHQLRHSFATDLLNDGARITDVSELLGHSALSTTEIYTKLSSSLKLKNYLDSHPLCKDDSL